LKQIEPDFPGITSEWMFAEMFRAFKKQVNLKRIEDKDAQIAIDLFLSQLGEYSQKKKLILIPVKMVFIMASRKFLFNQNLYAADAIHLSCAIEMNVDAFITFDSDFKKIEKIPVLNPSDENFQDIINQIKVKYTEK
jgi:predicted nucleic acid-binding protein